MEQIGLHLTGVAPLLMHRPLTVNPLEDLTKEIRKYTSKRKKTDEDHEFIRRLEWEAGMYHDDETGPYLPAVNVVTCLRDAAKMTKQGATVTRAVVSTGDKVPVLYKGPRGGNGRGLQDLWDANLKDYRRVGNQQNSVMRCRPMFPGWSMDVPLIIETELLDISDLMDIAVRAGKMIGLGDYRPRFGRFEVRS
jgi:hypothetical protein